MTRHPSARIGGMPEHRDWLGTDKTPLTPKVHDTAHVQPLVTIDAGIKQPTCVGPRTIILAKAHVGHDAWVGADCEIATGVIIGGHAEVHDGARVGLGAVVLPYRKVGRGATVGAGSVVTKDVPAGETWAGNPARKLEARDPRPYTERRGHCDNVWCVTCDLRSTA